MRRLIFQGKQFRGNCLGPNSVDTCSKRWFIGGIVQRIFRGKCRGAKVQGSRNKFCDVLLGKTFCHDLACFWSRGLVFQRLLVL